MLSSELIQISFDKIMQTRTYTVIILEGEGKKFAIYTDSNTGKILQMHLTGTEKQRPLTHDMIYSIFKGYEIQVKQLVINDIQDTIYFARLFLEQLRDDIRHIIEIDVRPSDGITLALMSNVPVYCTRDVLEKAIKVEE